MQADPAEVVRALLALHVVATPVLVDRNVAFRALLGESSKPHVLQAALQLLAEPDLHYVALQRLVRFFSTFEAHIDVAPGAPYVDGR